MSLSTRGELGENRPTEVRTVGGRRPQRSLLLGLATLLIGGIAVGAATIPAMANVAGSNDTGRATSTVGATRVTTHDVAYANTDTVRRHSSTTVVTKVKPIVAHASLTTTLRTLPAGAKGASTTNASRPRVTTTFDNSAPRSNVSPTPNFLAPGTSTLVNDVWTNSNPCVVGSATGISWPTYTDDAKCNEYVLAAINNARALEGIKAMVLPSNWYQLSTDQQLFVVADLERVDRGLPPYLGINAALSANAMHAAAAATDPTAATGYAVATDTQGSPAMGGAWSGGYSVLAADYFWMYADGWAGNASDTSNIACTSPRAPGCWAHRLELLGSDPGFNPGVGLNTTNAEMGVGFAMVKGAASYVDLIEVPAGATPPMSFTWAANVRPFLG